MSHRRPLGVAGDDAARLLISILADDQWFSVFKLEALLSGAAGVRWRQVLEGVITADDWDDVADEHPDAHIQTLAGSVHAPGAGWEIPVSISGEALIVPDTATTEQVAVIEKRLSALLSAA